MIKEISKEQIIDRIKFENPWWISGEIEEEYIEMNRRLYFDSFWNIAIKSSVKRGIVLLGTRRVGKTVLLYHLVEELINSGINPKKIIFVTIENPIYNNMPLENLFKIACEATGINDRDGWYVIFDEIQYLKDWEIHFKSLIDSYKNNKFIASGSAAAALKYASNESGAGRFTDFILPPLTFYEYINLKKLERIIISQKLSVETFEYDFYSTSHIDELNNHFIDYINFGGYPEVIFSEEIQNNPGRYIRQDIVDKVLLRDLPSLYGINDTLELNSLFSTIAYNSGAEFSLESLSKFSQVPKNTIKKYLNYLESAYLIKIIQRIDQGGKRFKRNNFFKIYLTNPSIRSALFSPINFSDEMFGNMVETAIYEQLIHQNNFTPWYARWNTGEVDLVYLNQFLKPEWCLEIKWSNRFYSKPEKLKSLIKFCKENNLKNTTVTTINKTGIKKIDGIIIKFIPAGVYAYNSSRNILENN